MADNEEVISVKIDTTEFEKGIDKLKKANDNALEKQIKALEKQVQTIKDSVEPIVKSVLRHAKKDFNTQFKEQKKLHNEKLKDIQVENKELFNGLNREMKERTKLQKKLKDKEINIEPQENEYTEKLKQLQQEHPQLQDLKSQQINLQNQSYNIKQAKLKNSDVDISREQKQANKKELDKQIELYNKQAKNTTDMALNLKEQANNIDKGAKNIDRQRKTTTFLRDTINGIGLKNISIMGAIMAFIKPLINYNNLKNNLLNQYAFAQESNIKVDKVRVITKVAKQFNDYDLPQLLKSLNTIEYATSGYKALSLINLEKKDLIGKNAIQRAELVYNHLQNLQNRLPKVVYTYILEQFATDLGLSKDYFLSQIGYKNGVHYNLLNPKLNAIKKGIITQTENPINQTSQQVLHNIQDKATTATQRDVTAEQKQLQQIDTIAKATQGVDKALETLQSVVLGIAKVLDKMYSLMELSNMKKEFSGLGIAIHNDIKRDMMMLDRAIPSAPHINNNTNQGAPR